MQSIKSYTDLEQSKKLAEILPLESADMVWANDVDVIVVPYDMVTRENVLHDFVPCWSLAALEHLIWNTSVDAVSCPHIYKERLTNEYYILYGNCETNTYSSIVDACMAMILKLHELKKL